MAEACSDERKAAGRSASAIFKRAAEIGEASKPKVSLAFNDKTLSAYEDAMLDADVDSFTG